MASKQSPRKPPAQPRRKASTHAVTVRMFCQGLGDCFLISVPQEGSRPYHMLIDCGIAMNTEQADLVMAKVVRRIAGLTDGKIDLLVITHEHYDHVSGFVHAANLLTRKNGGSPALSFKHFWFAWTESPKDKLAGELRGKYTKAKASIARASAALPDDARKRLTGILAFNGMDLSLAARKPCETKMGEAMNNLRSLYDRNGGEVDYLMPQTVEQLPGATGGIAEQMLAYVLGPPHDSAKVRKTKPGEKNPETYHKSGRAALNLDFAEICSAALTGGPAELENAAIGGASIPFDEQWRIEDIEGHPFFQQHYPNNSESEKLRRIDGEWLERGVQRLALHIESYTNNTSLALALELPLSKKVLLFPGDAQVGNWLSWHDAPFTFADKREVTAADLLKNTVFYKVGHHGSHNATLKEKGLEMMTHRQLTAMIPVESGAVKRLSYGEMPLESLVRELKARCNGRVLRLDEKWDGGQPPGTWSGLCPPIQSKDVIPEAGNRPTFIEYMIVDSR